MTMKERAYAFRRELDEVHKPDRRNHALQPKDNETAVDESWCIVLQDDTDPLIEYAATDLQDYFRVSMNLNLPLRRSIGERSIVLETASETGRKSRSFEFVVTEDTVRIVGSDPAGTAQGVYFLEDRMNLREAPFLERGSQWHEPLFSPWITLAEPGI